MVRDAGRFVVLLPVKSPGTGKSRLGGVSDDDRARLAAAFATDVADACLRTPTVAAVCVVTDDPNFARGLRGVVQCADPGGGLNAALRHAATRMRASHGHLRPAALCADLPALAPVDLADALATVGPEPCFVADAAGTGTTLYTAAYDDFDPRYGPGSAAAHGSCGAWALPGTLATLRRDVDDLADLDAAVELGVGTATATALARLTTQ